MPQQSNRTGIILLQCWRQPVNLFEWHSNPPLTRQQLQAILTEEWAANPQNYIWRLCLYVSEQAYYNSDQ